MLERVDHVAVGAADLEATLRFYRDGLRLAVTRDGIVDGRREVRMPVGGSAVVLRDAGVDRGIEALAFDADVAQPERPDRELNLGVQLVLLPRPNEGAGPAAPSNVRCIDHVVISSGDSGRCAAHFEERYGLEIKRKMIRPGTSAQLAFAKLGDVILEFAGPPEAKEGPLEAKFWGMVYAVDDIQAAIASVRAAGFEANEPKPAVQPTAVIASVRAPTGGVPTAIIQYNAR
ncbi:MAG: VOC family protein [Dehalococcoidia bacterium]